MTHTHTNCQVSAGFPGRWRGHFAPALPPSWRAGLRPKLEWGLAVLALWSSHLREGTGELSTWGFAPSTFHLVEGSRPQPPLLLTRHHSLPTGETGRWLVASGQNTLLGAVGRPCLLCGLSACGVEPELPRVSPRLPFPVSPHAPRDGCTLTWPWRSQGGPRTLLSGNSRALLLCLVQEADGNLTGKCLGLSTGPHHLSCCKRGASAYSRVQRLHPIPLPWPQAQVLSLPRPQASCSPDPLGPSP